MRLRVPQHTPTHLLPVAQEITNDGGLIYTSSPARHIDQKDGSVDVYSDDRVVTGKYVVVATPPHLSGRITYTPPLPARRAQLTQRMPMVRTWECGCELVRVVLEWGPAGNVPCCAVHWMKSAAVGYYMCQCVASLLRHSLLLYPCCRAPPSSAWPSTTLPSGARVPRAATSSRW